MRHQTTPTKTLEAMRDYFVANRAMPSFSALAKQLGRPLSTVADAVAKLKVEGFVKANATGRLEPGPRFFEREWVGHVQAGALTTASDVPVEGLFIDSYLVDAPNRSFLMSVRGESMRDAGLMPGDIVVVKRGALAEVGDIVVANMNNELTVKELARGDDGLFLRARNPAFPDIHPATDCEVVGTVVGQFRRYAKKLKRPRAT